MCTVVWSKRPQVAALVFQLGRVQIALNQSTVPSYLQPLESI